MKDIAQRETVLLAQRDIQAVIGGSGLQLKIKRATEALAQRQAPGFVDAGAERRVDDELHAAAFVEESLGDDYSLRRHCAQRSAAHGDVIDGLRRARIVQTTLLPEPVDRRASARGIWVPAANRLADVLAQF